MSADKIDIQAIFSQAIALELWEKRVQHLNQACGDDHLVRMRVEALLQAHSEAGGFFGGKLAQTIATEAHPLSETPGLQIGPYKLLQQIGEGGMGVVYLAEQSEPVNRRVALKIIKPGMDSRQIIARFEAERQALSLMDHPNIAKVFEAGTTDSGRPYFVMELVKGQPITAYCDDYRLTPRQRLQLLVPVCHAIQHAHHKGIIHRDIKPTNILVAEYDDQPVPKVIDFGVAKATSQALTERTMFTSLGQIVGTLEYMSPEQAKVNQLDIDTRSDIYSLGVLLYELLTGSTPFDKQRLHSAGWDEMLRIIREEEPPKPSTKLSNSEAPPSIAVNRSMEPTRLSRAVRGELDWIAMKALEKDRNRRYETANGLAMDLQRYLQDEPVRACPPSAIYRLHKLVQRHRSGVAIAALLLFLIVVLGGTIGWTLRDRADRQAKVAASLESTLDRAESYREQRKLAEARAAFERAELLSGETSKDSRLHDRLQTLKARLNADSRDQDFIAAFEDIRLRDQSEIDVRENRFASYRGIAPKVRELLRQHGIDVGNTPTPQALARIQGRPADIQAHLAAALWICLTTTIEDDTPTREWLVSLLDAADHDPLRRQVRRAWSEKNQQLLNQLALNVDVHTQPASFLLLAFGKPPLDLCRQIQAAYPADFWANHTLAIRLEDYSQHNEAVRYHTGALTLRPQNPGVYLSRASALRRANEPAGAVADLRQAIAIAPDYLAAHNALAIALASTGDFEGADAAVRQTLAIDPERDATYVGLNNVAWRMAISRNPKKRDPQRAIGLATIAAERVPGYAWNTLGVAQYRAGDWTAAIESLKKSMAAGQAGNGFDWFFLAMAHWQLGQQDEARDWYDRAATWMIKNYPDNEELRQFRYEAKQLLGVRDHRFFTGHTDRVRRVSAFSDGTRALSCSLDKTIRLWDLASGTQLACWEGHTGLVAAAMPSPDGRQAVSASRDRTMRLWDVATGQELRRFEHPGWVLYATVSPDCRFALSGSDSTAFLWNLETGAEVARFEGHTKGVVALDFSPDGKTFLSGSHDKTVRLWDVSAVREIRRFEGHTDLVWSVAFSPDGRQALSGGQDRKLRLWDIETGRQISEFSGHQGIIEGVAYLPDGLRAVTGGGDGTIRLWDLNSGRELHSFGSNQATSVAVSPDGQTVISGHVDNCMRLWTLPNAEHEIVRSETDPEP